MTIINSDVTAAYCVLFKSEGTMKAIHIDFIWCQLEHFNTVNHYPYLVLMLHAPITLHISTEDDMHFKTN